VADLNCHKFKDGDARKGPRQRKSRVFQPVTKGSVTSEYKGKARQRHQDTGPEKTSAVNGIPIALSGGQRNSSGADIAR